MKKIKIYPLQSPISATVAVPGSLSCTIRALAIAAMVRGSIKITNPAKSDDSYTMVHLLQDLGITIEEGDTYFIVHGSICDIENKIYKLNAHLSGRTARIVLGMLTIIPGIKILTCDEGFKKRPVKDLVDGLRQLGATIAYLEEKGFLPVKISSDRLTAGSIEIKGTVSSQFISSILLISPFVGEITIHVVDEQSSRSFIDMTLDLMQVFGVSVINKNYEQYIVFPNQKYQHIKEYTVEADAIAATYFWAIAALTKSNIKVFPIDPDSSQGDVMFADILKEMGCIVKKSTFGKSIEVQGTESLTGISLDMNHMPDSAVTLMVVSAFAKGKTNLTGLHHLKVKESDRLHGPMEELKKMNIAGIAARDSITITGGNPSSTTIETYGDHRMAMAFAVAGTTLADGIIITNPDVVNKSFPDFWKTVEKIGIKIEYL